MKSHLMSFDKMLPFLPSWINGAADLTSNWPPPGAPNEVVVPPAIAAGEAQGGVDPADVLEACPCGIIL